MSDDHDRINNLLKKLNELLDDVRDLQKRVTYLETWMEDMEEES